MNIVVVSFPIYYYPVSHHISNFLFNTSQQYHALILLKVLCIFHIFVWYLIFFRILSGIILCHISNIFYVYRNTNVFRLIATEVNMAMCAYKYFYIQACYIWTEV